MVRPFKPRNLRSKPCVTYFKPQGIPLRSIEEIELAADEFEAIQLYDYEGLDQILAAQKMEIS